MSDYQVIARKFRPKSFKDVVGQEAIVTTLKNAIKFNRLAQAYLFCGSRGTGKTTLARLLAKALNCQEPTPDHEPCNQCSACREITASSSLEVLEIDGASHRGIEDIRQINETVGYTTALGRYKIYIIDEVHMLTKEAFNALLKTLEEPPPKVKFFFATTEPHKVPSTILSRCQRFNLNRIPLSQIINKLRFIAHHLEVKVEEEALRLIAQRAEGGLRDAESLFDQIFAFEEGMITVATVTTVLGLMPREIYFEIDVAGKEGDFAKAFEIAHRLFSEGKELMYFIEGLIDHLRHILMIKISGADSSLLFLTDSEKERYLQTAHLYSQEQCLDLIEYLLEAQTQLRLTTFSKVSLEMILLHVMRSHFRLTIEQLVRHVSELDHLIHEKNENVLPLPPSVRSPPRELSNTPSPKPLVNAISKPVTLNPPSPILNNALLLNPGTPVINSKPKIESDSANLKATTSLSKASLSTPSKPNEPSTTTPLKSPTLFDAFISEDPTPSPSDLGKGNSFTKIMIPLPKSPIANTSTPLSAHKELIRPLYEYDTLLHFAAVELEGKLQKNQR